MATLSQRITDLSNAIALDIKTQKTKLNGIQAGATATRVHYIRVLTNNPPRVDPLGAAIPTDATWFVIWVDDGTHTVDNALASVDLVLNNAVTA